MEKEKFNPTAYKNKFNAENYDRLYITVPKGDKERINAHAKSKGYKGINTYINDLITEDIKKGS